MRILVVGAGAIGQVYAYHLQKAGHEVYFYVKEKYAQEMSGDQYLYPLNRSNPRKASVAFQANGVITSPEEVGKLKWDQVYLCMSSTGLLGSWMGPFSKQVGDATIISLQSGMEDRNYLLKFYPDEQIVSGMLSIISYHAPLPGEVVPRPGMAYWYPPLSPSPFSGESRRTKAVVEALNKGGYPAKISKDVSAMVALPSAILMCLISGLELSDWSFKKFSGSERLKDTCKAIKEASQVISKSGGKGSALTAAFFTPISIRALMKLSPYVIPLPIEVYLQAHFTKVGDQTRMYMKQNTDLGQRLGVSVPALTRLTQGLG